MKFWDSRYVKLNLQTVIHSIAVHSHKNEKMLMEKYLNLKAAGINDLTILESMIFNNEDF